MMEDGEEMMTDLVIRTGNKEFDWVIVDINNLRNI
jgi:hypothetical protein